MPSTPSRRRPETWGERDGSSLASERGRRLRRGLAAALILGAPLAGELPVIRRTALGRVLRFAGATALVVKGAEWIRDWDPNAPIAS